MQLPEGFKFLIQNGDKGFEESVIMADSNFFKVFSYKFKEGDPATALSSPNSIILTEDAAKKYFGNEDAIGKPLKVSAFGGQIRKFPASISIAWSNYHAGGVV